MAKYFELLPLSGLKAAILGCTTFRKFERLGKQLPNQRGTNMRVLLKRVDGNFAVTVQIGLIGPLQE